MRIFIVRSLHQIEIRITQNEPFCAGSLKIDFYPSVGPLALIIKDHAIAEFLVANALPKSNTKFVSGTGSRRSALCWP